MANSAMVAGTTKTTPGVPHRVQLTRSSATPHTNDKAPSSLQTINVSTIKSKLLNKGYNVNVACTMIDARSKNTYNQYQTYWDRWAVFCKSAEVDPEFPPMPPVLNFLQQCRETHNLGYSAINTARSALSLIAEHNGVPVGQNEDMATYLKGVRNQYPHLPKYSTIWDADILLAHMESLGEPQTLDLKTLSVKLAALILLASAQRVQTLPHLSIDHLLFTEDGAKFVVLDKLKHTTKQGTEIVLKSFPGSPALCVVQHLSMYIKCTEPVRTSTSLLLSYQKPFHPVGTQTLGRWLRGLLQDAGINLQAFGPHSIRAASSAAAKRGGAQVDTILKAGCWAQESTYTKWYEKPISNQGPTFHQAVMHSFAKM